MDYQEVLSRFTYDDGTDIRNRISAVEAGDYRENRDIINEIVLWKMNRRPQVTEELIDAIFSLKEIKTPLQVLTDEKTGRVVENYCKRRECSFRWQVRYCIFITRRYSPLLIRGRIGSFMLWIIPKR